MPAARPEADRREVGRPPAPPTPAAPRVCGAVFADRQFARPADDARPVHLRALFDE